MILGGDNLVRVETRRVVGVKVFVDEHAIDLSFLVDARLDVYLALEVGWHEPERHAFDGELFPVL